MRTLSALVAFLISSAGVAAPPGEKPMGDGRMVGEAVTQPLADVNVKKREIPSALQVIRNDPYALDGVQSCREIIGEIDKLDAVLGDDFDQPVDDDKTQRRKEAASRIAGSVIASLIPFRGIVREVSGANKTDQDFREAIYAGAVRRAFLKGYGLQRQCAPPGRPLTATERRPPATDEAAPEGTKR